jgi:tetratricopeptide (TPR) repeat protein
VSKSEAETKQERDGEADEHSAEDASERSPEAVAAASEGPAEASEGTPAPAEAEVAAEAEQADPARADTEAASEAAEATSDEATAERPAPAKATAAAAMTPGQRLAAARAKKAAKKSSERGRDADQREQKAIDTAEVARRAATNYLETHSRVVWGALGVIALAFVAFLGFRRWQAGQNEAAGALLEEANAIYLTRVQVEGDPEGARPDPDVEPYTSWGARADAALAKYRAITEQYPGSDAAAWAWLGQGRAHLEKREPAEARRAYQKAAQAAEENAEIQRLAFEGVGFSYEAEENWDEALSTYDELGAVANGVYESWSDYHAARMLLRKGKRDEAKQRLQAAMERLGAASAPRSVFLRREVQARLAILDPSLAERATAGGGGGGANLSPEQIQELIRQAQARQQAESGGAP